MQWEEGSEYFKVPLGVTIKQIKEEKYRKNQITMFDIDQKMYSTTDSAAQVQSPPEVVHGKTEEKKKVELR